MKRVLLHTLAAVAVLATAACGGEGATAGGDDDDDGGSQPMDSATAQRTGSGLASSAEFGARAYNLNMGAAFLCDSVTSSGDTDGDGIPDFPAIEHTDCSKMTAWGQGVVNGDEAITDNQPTVAGVDYSLAQSLEIALASSGDHVSFDSAQTAEQAGSLFLLNEATDIDRTGHDAAGAYSTTEEIAWAKAYEPGSAWAPGDPAVAGTYSVDGAYRVTFVQNGVSTVVEAAVSTEAPLTLDPACATLVVGGSITAVVGDGANAQILDVTWTGCNASGTELLPSP